MKEKVKKGGNDEVNGQGGRECPGPTRGCNNMLQTIVFTLQE